MKMRYTVEDICQMAEGQTFDCKSIRIEPKALANTIVAMANADGGMISVGITDKSRRIQGLCKEGWLWEVPDGVSSGEQRTRNIIWSLSL